MQIGCGVKNSGSPRCALPPHPEFLESLEPDLPALRAMGLRLWAAGPETHPAGISDLLAEASAEVDEPVPGYLSAPQSIMDTCLYIFTSGTTGEPWTYVPEIRQRKARGWEQELWPQFPGHPSKASGPLHPGPDDQTHFSTCLNFPHFQDSSASLLSFSLASASLLETQQGQGEAGPEAHALPAPTGLPKAARISHLKILQCQAFYELCGAHQEDVIYLALPLYHMSGSLLGIVGCLGIGQSPQFPPQSSPHL